MTIKENLLDAQSIKEVEEIIINWENQLSIDNEFLWKIA